MIPEKVVFPIEPDGTASVEYTWEGEKIPATQLKFSAEFGETVEFAETENGGIMTVKVAKEAGEITISHEKDWMAPVCLNPQMIILPGYKLEVLNESSEIFDDEDVNLKVTMVGNMPEGASEEAGITFQKAQESGGYETLAENAGKELSFSLPAGEHKLSAVVTVSCLGQTYAIRTEEITVSIVAVEFADNGLRFRIIRANDDGGKYAEYAGNLKLLGFEDGKETADLTVKGVGDRKVVVIGEGAFAGNTVLTSITLPNSVVVIEKRAFMNCSKLATMVCTD